MKNDLIFVMMAVGGHLNSNRANQPSKGRQNRHCLPPSDNRQKRTMGAADLAASRQFLPAVTGIQPLKAVPF